MARAESVENIMGRIRSELRKEASSVDSSNSHAKETLSRSDSVNSQVAGDSSSPLLYSDDLNYLNAHWNDWVVPNEISSHRKILGKLIVAVKRIIADVAWKAFFRGYFDRERQYAMRLVQHLNATARYIDSRDKELFWQLIHKVDQEVSGIVARNDVVVQELQRHLVSQELSFRKEIELLRAEIALLKKTR